MTRFPDGTVEKVLGDLGIEVVEEKGDELVAACPGHRDSKGNRVIDHNPSWSINAQSGVHYCFSCQFKGNLYTLAVEIKGRAYASQLLGDEWQPSSVDTGYRVNRMMEMPQAGDFWKQPEPMPRSVLALFVEPPRWAVTQRDLREAAVAHFGVLWDERRETWVLPIRTPTGALLGFQAKGQTDRKLVRNYPYGVQKGLTLFGYDVLQPGGVVVVVESPLDAVRLYGLGHKAVALMGSRMSQAQVELVQRGFDHVVLALDNDEAGRRETQRLKWNRTYDPSRKPSMSEIPSAGFATVEYTGPEKDFGEMRPEDIDAVLAKARV